jgi:pantothenate kinase type III
MILAVDIGNTQTVLGLFEGDVLDAHWRVSTDATLTADELRVKIGGLLSAEGLAWSSVRRFVVSSVVPVLTLAYEEMAQRATGKPPMVVGPGIKTGVPIKYENPHEVGADRIVNAVAALQRFAPPLVVVDFGTATTIDVIDAEGSYIGGAIAPGVETSAEALFSRAARLSTVDLETPYGPLDVGLQIPTPYVDETRANARVDAVKLVDSYTGDVLYSNTTQWYSHTADAEENLHVYDDLVDAGAGRPNGVPVVWPTLEVWQWVTVNKAVPGVGGAGGYEHSSYQHWGNADQAIVIWTPSSDTMRIEPWFRDP